MSYTMGSALTVAALLAFGVSNARAQVDMLTNHNDNYRTGANLKERVLSPANVNRAQFGMLFKRVLDDQLYTQPLIATHVAVGGGTHDVVYVTTVNNSVYAFDA
ncbi:MAG: pyrrolo-quinoline quinone, partial [bacterium]